VQAACPKCTSGELLLLPNQLIKRRYYDQFNFYFAKPVNEILAGCHQPHVILYKDLLYFDQQTENL
jgi:hypothetical protein